MYLAEFIYYFNGEQVSLIRLVEASQKDIAYQKARNWFITNFNGNNIELIEIDLSEPI
ncbi:MAG TPA: hypothetical protein VFF27_07150 [Bacteroidia bacterium]|jgi:hypothetical protein|nr:hypothetical protein [Bacteroidia bacterium]